MTMIYDLTDRRRTKRMCELNAIDPMTEEEKIITASERLRVQTAQGMVVSVEPDLADAMGAFEETAISEEDAEDAHLDLLELRIKQGVL